MRDITYFSENTVAQFDGNYDNMLEFNEVVVAAGRGQYEKYSKAEVDKIARKQFDRILGINFKSASPKARRQALRKNKIEIAQLIEDALYDKMVSGWTDANPTFMQWVDTKNLEDGDVNEFYVEDNSLLQVSKFAGNHHDIVRQAVHPGKSFSIDTSWYVVKFYTDFELFQLGKIDLGTMLNRIYKSIEEYRYAGLFAAFMTMDKSLPSDMVLETPVEEATKEAIIEHIEAVKAATGKDVVIVGTRPAVQKLQSTINYALFSGEMKNERNQKGLLGMWEGYSCMALDRVNKAGTRENVFTADDNKKLLVLPIDGDFKPIKHVMEGDVVYNEAGTNGETLDMTTTMDVRYKEGIGVVINQLFGEIKIK